MGIYLIDKILISFYSKTSDFYIDILNLRLYLSVGFTSIVLLALVYIHINKTKKYKAIINSNLKEIHNREIDLYHLETKTNSQKVLIDNIINSTSLLIVYLDEDFSIKEIIGDLNLFPCLDQENTLGKKIDILFKDDIDFQNIIDGKLKKFEIQLCSNSKENNYVLMNINPIYNTSNGNEYVAIMADITQKKLLEDQIEYLDYYDSLTDLPNRVLLEMKYRSLRSKTDFRTHCISFLYLDIDDFKNINDTLNHQAGDEFLVYISKLLKSSISQDDLLARITQDEFAIILHHIHSKEKIENTIRRIYDKLENPWIFRGNEYNVGATIGVSIAPLDGEDFDSLLKNSHLSSQYLKTHDKGNYEYYSKNLEEEVLNGLNMINELRIALQRDEFTLYYQTVVDLKTNKIVGVEALIRWIHPKRGMVSPMEFIPLVENTVLAYDLANIVLNKALRQKRDWNLNNINIPRVSINISSKTFSQENFGKLMEDTIADYGLKNSEVILELTESGFAEDTNHIEMNIDYLRNIGVEIAMDDFGTGYSTLARLKTLPIDYLKLDKTFIDKMKKNSEEAVMVNSVISLAKRFGMVILAEGIETQEQFTLLKDMGCDLGQGYYISRPVPAKDLEV